MRIGQRIRRLRREAKKTLLEVATEAKLSVGFLSQVERHLTGISLSSLVNVAKALGVPLGALIDQPRRPSPIRTRAAASRTRSTPGRSGTNASPPRSTAARSTRSRCR